MHWDYFLVIIIFHRDCSGGAWSITGWRRGEVTRSRAHRAGQLAGLNPGPVLWWPAEPEPSWATVQSKPRRGRSTTSACATETRPAGTWSPWGGSLEGLLLLVFMTFGILTEFVREWRTLLSWWILLDFCNFILYILFGIKTYPRDRQTWPSAITYFHHGPWWWSHCILYYIQQTLVLV